MMIDQTRSAALSLRVVAKRTITHTARINNR